MNIIQEFTQLANDLFNEFESAIDQNVVFKKLIDNGTYNTSTGKQEAIFQDYTGVRAYRRNYEQNEIQGVIQSGDIEIKILGQDIPVKISPNDLIVLENGTEFNVITPDPRNVKDGIAFFCQCREKKD